MPSFRHVFIQSNKTTAVSSGVTAGSTANLNAISHVPDVAAVGVQRSVWVQDRQESVRRSYRPLVVSPFNTNWLKAKIGPIFAFWLKGHKSNDEIKLFVYNQAPLH